MEQLLRLGVQGFVALRLPDLPRYLSTQGRISFGCRVEGLGCRDSATRYPKFCGPCAEG